MNKKTCLKLSLFLFSCVAFIAFNIVSYQRYAPYDKIEKTYFPQTDDVIFDIVVDGELLHTNPQNSFYFYNNFVAGANCNSKLQLLIK